MKRLLLTLTILSFALPCFAQPKVKAWFRTDIKKVSMRGIGIVAMPDFKGKNPSSFVIDCRTKTTMLVLVSDTQYTIDQLTSRGLTKVAEDPEKIKDLKVKAKHIDNINKHRKILGDKKIDYKASDLP